MDVDDPFDRPGEVFGHRDHVAVTDLAGQGGDALGDGDAHGLVGEGEEALDDAVPDLCGQFLVGAEEDLEEIGAADDALELCRRRRPPGAA